MFDNLTDKLQRVIDNFRKCGKVTQKDLKTGLREIRIALLEADVNFKVVKKFIRDVEEKAIGSRVMESLTPAQQIVKIVRDELILLMGGDNVQRNINLDEPLTKVMLVGLHGSGKTTTAGKIALKLKKEGYRPLLVALDIYRAAAIEQLVVLGKQLCVDVYSKKEVSPVNIALGAIEYANENAFNVVIFDTAGRLQINDELMQELREIKFRVAPSEILLVADAMTGQDAVNIASGFDKPLDITGVVLTKMDGDARGGAALSIMAVTGKPVKFIGVGEKLDQLEYFYPDRMANRILGMGDVLSLVEKAESVYSEDKVREMERKLVEDAFTLEDFREQIRQVKKMGSMQDILGMIPGISSKDLKGINFEEKNLIKVEAIIDSMTKQERLNHTIINGSRKRRIAAGSGTSVTDVNRLLKQFVQTKKMIKQLTRGVGKKKRMKRHLHELMEFF